jgi:hypothetical protein
MMAMGTASRADINAGFWTNLRRSHHVCLLNGEHVVDDIQRYLERRSDGFSPVDRRIARYIGMLESTKINLRILAQFRATI